MSSAQLQARRATLDDLPGLRKLWEHSGVADRSLEQRLTEFQVVEDMSGTIVACSRIQIESRQGKVDHCLCHNPEFRDSTQLLLWQRIQSLAQNHGLVRLRSQDSDKFWINHGFSKANDILRQKIPSEFGESMENWMTLQLRDESLDGLSLEQHLELFKNSQKQSTQKTQGRIRVVRWIAGAAALVVIIALIWIAWVMVNHIVGPST